MEQQFPNELTTDFLMGGVAAAIAKTATAPIERIKLLVALNRSLAEVGYLSLWRGNVINVLRYAPTQALNFAFKDDLRRSFAVPHNAPLTQHALYNTVAGGVAGAVSLAFLYPIDYARVRLATDMAQARFGGTRQYTGFLDVFKKLGVKGMYNRLGVSLVGITVYRGLYFGLFDTFNPLIHKRLKSAWFSGLSSFFLAWGVTVAAGVAAYPIDTIRRRVMMTSYNGKVDHDKSAIRTCYEIVNKEGFKSLYKGAGANVTRAFAGAVTLVVYDLLQRTAIGTSTSIT